MKNAMKLSILMMAAILSACSAKYRVEGLPPDAEPGRVVDGVPFRVNQRYIVHIYHRDPKDPKEGGYKEVGKFPYNLPNPDKIYVLKLNAGFLSDSTTTFDLNLDGTLNKVSVLSTSQGTDVLDALGTQTTTVTTALNNRRVAEETNITNEVSLDRIAMIAEDNVKKAEEKLNNLDSKASSADRLQAEIDLRVAKFDANEAFRLAGRATPYPGVFP